MIAAPPPGSSRLPQLFPGNREERAEVRRLVDWFHGKFDREVSRDLLFEKVYKRMRNSGASAPDPEILRAVRANLKYHLSYVSYLADARRWLAGDDMSFADMAAAAHISTVDYLGEVPWRDFAPAKAWYQRVKSRPSFRTLLADKVPGTPPPVEYADLDF
jgi:glutathione S-transferase